jgi:hypothetical protein
MSVSAFAQTPTGDAYGGLAGISQGPAGGTGGKSAAAAPAATTAADTKGKLPFTGLDLGVFAVIGAGLLGTGLVLHRTLRTNHTQA